MNTNIQTNINTYLIKHNMLTDYMQYKAYGEENHIKHASHIKKIQNKKVKSSKTLSER